VRGAVLFGVSCDAFASRMLRYTYGIQTRSRFDESNAHHKGLDADSYITCTAKGIPFVRVCGVFHTFAKVRVSMALLFVEHQAVLRVPD
jgi:hypothetical protein